MLEAETRKRPKRDRYIAASIFSSIAVFGFLVLHTALRWNLIPGIRGTRLEVPMMCVYFAAMFLFLLAAGYFDKP
jgi:hypothetical protein